MVSRGRVVIFSAFGGLGLLMLGLVLYANSGQPELQKITVDLSDVKVLDVNKINKRANLEVDFAVTNPSTITATISSITYELFVNGKSLGSGNFNTADVSMVGRAPLFPNSTVTLTNTFQLVDTDNISNEYDAITSGQHLSYKLTGQVTIESAWTLVTKDIQSSLN